MFFRFPENLIQNKNKVYIVDKKFADVNGDGYIETLIITGKKPYGENGFIKDITLTVKNEKTGLNIKVKPKENSGYEPNLFIGRFDEKSSIPYVFLSIASGGSGGYYFNYIYSFKRNVAEVVFDYDKFSIENVYNAVYENFYRVSVKSENKDLKGIIDLKSIRDEEYLSKLYNKDGTLKEPTAAGVLFLSNLSPLSINGSEVFKLLTNQRIIGIYNADTLGYVESILKWDKDKFIPLVTRLVVSM
ncbi:hypothetical protein Ccar_02760 [Clostridium carboxidivorans P7]|uniref:VCBS repeat-containing protein n=1 Tax=Clostridium carboxidivorans P7 TaxID=536227 RepID=C6PMU4_9CLOT|nr:hypothetical protein [Clostridium carboxidivorans]AKN29822.1 hypothetical protein Ccar_02760 [Clostridium carboxidivorans P7]EET89522.1 conserved hypothetical protein [Clostridium carboxidivorans P7]